MPLLPCAAILFNSIVMMKTDLMDIALFVGWSTIGIAVYFVYGINHSKLIEYHEIPTSPIGIAKQDEVKEMNA